MRKYLIVLLLAVPMAQAAYRCKDEKGITHIGDTPPEKCANVVMYEISRGGMVLRTIEPSLTPEQAKAREEEAARAKEKARQEDEQRRKDLALLATYTSPKDIEMTRDRNLEPIKGRMKSAQERIAALDKRQTALEEEMEFYKAGKSKAASGKTREAPAQLKSDLERARSERATITTNIASYEKEIEQVRARYDADRDRWVELKRMQSEGKLDLRDPKQIEASKRNEPAKPGTKKYNLYLVPAN
jgi:chromosome segregation ATPase